MTSNIAVSDVAQARGEQMMSFPLTFTSEESLARTLACPPPGKWTRTTEAALAAAAISSHLKEDLNVSQAETSASESLQREVERAIRTRFLSWVTLHATLSAELHTQMSPHHYARQK